MATSTEVAIATTTLGSASSTITFSSIPATYTDLRMVITGTNSASLKVYALRFNSDTGSNYSYTILGGNGTTAFTLGYTSQTFIDFGNVDGQSTTIPTFSSVDIFGYAGSTNKTLLATTSGDYNGSGDVLRTVGLWRSTAAINTINLLLDGGGNFAAGTTATLYGIN